MAGRPTRSASQRVVWGAQGPLLFCRTRPNATRPPIGSHIPCGRVGCATWTSPRKAFAIAEPSPAGWPPTLCRRTCRHRPPHDSTGCALNASGHRCGFVAGEASPPPPDIAPEAPVDWAPPGRTWHRMPSSNPEDGAAIRPPLAHGCPRKHAHPGPPHGCGHPEWPAHRPVG